MLTTGIFYRLEKCQGQNSGFFLEFQVLGGFFRIVEFLGIFWNFKVIEDFKDFVLISQFSVEQEMMLFGILSLR